MGVAEAPESGGESASVVVEIERETGGLTRFDVASDADPVGVALAALLAPGGDPRNATSLAMRTGDPVADELLESLAPLLGDLLAGLTERQRTVARLLLVERLRQAEVAQRLGVRRATVSVMAGRFRPIERLVRALRTIVAGAGHPDRPSADTLQSVVGT